MRKITVTNGEMTDKEKQKYVEYLEAKHNREIDTLEITINDEEVDLYYTFKPVNFERIRRITGYLTSDLKNWNKAKQAEEHDRVKHKYDVEEI